MVRREVRHLNWLLPLLPPCHRYCEPFGGSAAVLFNRPPSPVETYNDIDGEVVNFFKVLRDQKEKLVEAIALTPFSREEFYVAVTKGNEKMSRQERTRRFYVRARQARTGLAQTASLGRIEGKAAVSSYRCDLMDTLYRDWWRADAPVKNCHFIRKPRREPVWMNC